MNSLLNQVWKSTAAVVLAAFIAAPVLAQDPSAAPGQNQNQEQSSSQVGSSDQDSGGQDQTQSSGQDTTDQAKKDPAGQPTSDQTKTSSDQGTRSRMSVSADQETEIKGFIAGREGDNFIVVTRDGQQATVVVNSQTEFKEKKSNPFRSSKKYSTENLLPGLRVEVEGRGDSSGNLVAEEIKFRNDDFETAYSIATRVKPVERDLAEARANAERMSGQLEELSAVSNAARGGAVAAQESADRAMTAAGNAQSRADEAVTGVNAANERIVSLDNYDIRHNVTVNFKVNSAKLSEEATADLDEIASHINNEKGYIIEITGFASADGGQDYNRKLSQRRADAVVRYMAEKHNVPLRRIVVPFGYGELQPVADNTTREGRQQNRRVEVRIMVNRGIHGQSAEATTGNQTGNGGTMRTDGADNSSGSMERSTTDTGSRPGTTGDRGTTGNTSNPAGANQNKSRSE